MEHFEAGFRKRHRLRDKLIIVVNGKGGVGKDTVCALTARLFYAKTISSITPVKEIAVQCGWKGEKDIRARRFLADLKQLLIAYNDFPNQYLTREVQAFQADPGADILFVHIREADQIEEFLRLIHGKAVTLLIRSSRPGLSSAVYGNSADDDVERYHYDYIFDNDCGQAVLFQAVERFMTALLRQEQLLD